MALRTLLILIFTISLTLLTSAQDDSYFTNKYQKYNSDRTLRLEYIENDEDYTNVYVSYTGTSNVGSYSSLYLNNFRLVDRETGAEYRPIMTGPLSTNSGSKFYLYNSNEPLLLTLVFKRLPSYVKKIDLVEAEGSPSATYNFTFRDLVLNPSADDKNFYSWFYSQSYPNYVCLYTYDNVQIDIWVDGTYINKIDQRFTDANYKPNTGEFGTMTIGYKSNKVHSFQGSASAPPDYKYSWNFSAEPKENCSCQNLRIK